MRNRLLTTALLTAALSTQAHAATTYLGNLLIDGQGTDLSNLHFTLEDGSRANALDGFGSGLAYAGLSPKPNTYRFVSITDRGPNRAQTTHDENVDNTTSYPTRAQTWDITLNPAPAGKYALSIQLVKTTLFTTEAGERLVGRSDQFTSTDPSKNLRFDPESIRVAPDGSLWVSDEYGPSVFHFDPNGKRIGIMKVPPYYQITNLSGKAEVEIQNNNIGRVTNKGFEGLAISPDGSKLIAAMQAPLLQDGGDKTRFTRFAIFDAHTGNLLKEVVYALDASPNDPDDNSSKNSISDIVAINDHEMLVDERDGKKNKTKLAYIADLNAATDIAGRTTILKNNDLDTAITPTPKKLFIDVKKTILATDPLTHVPSGYTTGIPDKLEGFAFGPLLPDGKRLLVITNDNDFLLPSFANGQSKTNQSPDGTAGYPNYFFILETDVTDLTTFTEEQFTTHTTASAAAK
ncbi:MAG TPA: esterase-like activity of phytase family protein [Phycisphaerae bacterium]|nr:esterase-like activity of phytase family protein [Phycisphaerae bacterium]